MIRTIKNLFVTLAVCIILAAVIFYIIANSFKVRLVYDSDNIIAYDFECSYESEKYSLKIKGKLEEETGAFKVTSEEEKGSADNKTYIKENLLNNMLPWTGKTISIIKINDDYNVTILDRIVTSNENSINVQDDYIGRYNIVYDNDNIKEVNGNLRYGLESLFDKNIETTKYTFKVYNIKMRKDK